MEHFKAVLEIPLERTTVKLKIIMIFKKWASMQQVRTNDK